MPTPSITALGVPPSSDFGGGSPLLPGAALARAELEEALPVLARRLVGLAPAGQAEWRKLATIRGRSFCPSPFVSDIGP